MSNPNSPTDIATLLSAAGRTAFHLEQRDAWQRFTDADRCVIDRRPNPHLSFGAGPHTCLGAHLARAEIRVALGEIFALMPDYRLDPDGSLEYTPHGDLRGFWKLPVTLRPSA